MPRRRSISEDLLFDEELNALSETAQNLFFRMLSVADDCGVVPAEQYRLSKMLNLRPTVARRLTDLLHEIIDVNGKGLGRVIEFGGHPFFAFKLDSFLKHQGHILNKRKRSEYLGIDKEEYDSRTFPDFPGFSGKGASNVQTRLSGVERESSKIQVESIKGGESERGEATAGLPVELDTPEFRETWEMYRLHRLQIGHKLTPLSEQLAIKKLSERDVGTAIAMVKQSIERGWRGIFELKDRENGKGHGTSGSGNSGERPIITADTIRRDVAYAEEVKRRQAERNRGSGP